MNRLDSFKLEDVAVCAMFGWLAGRDGEPWFAPAVTVALCAVVRWIRWEVPVGWAGEAIAARYRAWRGR